MENCRERELSTANKKPMSRTAIMVWLLAVSCTDSRAAETIQHINVSVGQTVMLPCPCSEDTIKLVWQIGEEIVVNHCCEEKYPPHKSYVNRTQIFLSSTKGNCSLRLHDVSLDDEKVFTCFFFIKEKKSLNIYKVELKVEGLEEGNADLWNNQSTSDYHIKPKTGYFVGIPLSLIVIILLGLIVALLIRKHRQRRPRMVRIQDPQTKLPMMNHTTV